MAANNMHVPIIINVARINPATQPVTNHKMSIIGAVTINAPFVSLSMSLFMI